MSVCGAARRGLRERSQAVSQGFDPECCKWPRCLHLLHEGGADQLTAVEGAVEAGEVLCGRDESACGPAVRRAQHADVGHWRLAQQLVAVRVWPLDPRLAVEARRLQAGGGEDPRLQFRAEWVSGRPLDDQPEQDVAGAAVVPSGSGCKARLVLV